MYLLYILYTLCIIYYIYCMYILYIQHTIHMHPDHFPPLTLHSFSFPDKSSLENDLRKSVNALS